MANFLTKQHLSRRTALKGLGATIALPFLDAMLPASTAWAKVADRKLRLIAMEMVHGANMAFGLCPLLSFGAIYFLLAVTFRSYAQPLMILCVIPFAIVGALVGHLMFGISFALFSWLGMIAAIGVVVNDNVVLVDRCNQIRGYFALRMKGSGAPLPEEEGWEPHEITLPNGQVVEYVGIAPDLEPHEEMIIEGAASGFQKGPIDLKTSQQMSDGPEYRERAEQLEAMGFQVMRVKAEAGITEASVSRFRQIFLTSVTEFIGTSPMILENAAIVQFLKPMVISLAFGVLICMPATLILTPVFYMIGLDFKRFFGGLFGCDQRTLHQRAVSDDGQVFAFAHDFGFAERNHEIASGILALVIRLAVQVFVFQEQHRIVRANCRAQQSVGVQRVGRHDDSPAGNLREGRNTGLTVINRAAG